MWQFLSDLADLVWECVKWMFVQVLIIVEHVLAWCESVARYLSRLVSAVLIRLRKEQVVNALSRIVPEHAIANAKVIYLKGFVDEKTNTLLTTGDYRAETEVILSEQDSRTGPTEQSPVTKYKIAG